MNVTWRLTVEGSCRRRHPGRLIRIVRGGLKGGLRIPGGVGLGHNASCQEHVSPVYQDMTAFILEDAQSVQHLYAEVAGNKVNCAGLLVAPVTPHLLCCWGQ